MPLLSHGDLHEILTDVIEEAKEAGRPEIMYLLAVMRSQVRAHYEKSVLERMTLQGKKEE